MFLRFGFALCFCAGENFSRHLQSRYPRTKLVVGVWDSPAIWRKRCSVFKPLRPDAGYQPLLMPLTLLPLRFSRDG
jgi:hypothetical protein